jgi:cell division protein FtsB
VKRRATGTVLLALVALGALFGALSLVTWRQARALEALSELERVRRDISLAEAERAELEQRIQTLEGRGYVSTRARELLGMHQPDDREIVFLTAEES